MDTLVRLEVRLMPIRIRRPNLCRCGHIRDMHTHYTNGTWCSSCRTCDRWKRVTRLIIEWGKRG